MKILDIILLVMLFFGAYKGYQKGLIMEVIQIVAFLLAIILGLKLIHVGIFYLKPYTGDLNGFLPFLSFILIFVATIYLVKFIGKLAKEFAKMVLLGWLDKFVGALLSATKWALALSLVIWAAHSVGFKPNGTVINQTFLYKNLLNVAPDLLSGIGNVVPFVKDIFDYIKSV